MLKEYLAAKQHSNPEELWKDNWRSHKHIDRHRSVVRSDEYSVLRPCLAGLRSGARILDAGCGLGQWTLYLSSRGYSVTGVDIVRDTVKTLQEKYGEQMFLCCDMRALPYEDNTFDAYISLGVIEHFEEGPSACLAEALRILKPGGLLFVSVPFHNARLKIFQRDNSRGTGGIFYQYRFDVEDFRKVLGENGCNIKILQPIHQWHGFVRFLAAQLKFNVEGMGEISLKSTNSQLLRKSWLAPFYLLSKFVPRSLFSHMLIAVAEK